MSLANALAVAQAGRVAGPARRSAAARAAAAGEPPGGHRRLGPRAHPGRARDDPPTTGGCSCRRPGGSTRRCARSPRRSSTRAGCGSRPGLERQQLDGHRRRSTAPASGTCRSSTRATRASSPEEVEAVARLVERLAGARRPRGPNNDGPAHPLAPRRDPDRRALQRPGGAARRAARPRGPGRHGRQVPGPGGAGGDLLDDHVVARGGAPGDGVPLQPEPAQRRDLPRPLRLRPGRRARCSSSPSAARPGRWSWRTRSAGTWRWRRWWASGLRALSTGAGSSPTRASASLPAGLRRACVGPCRPERRA